ncbi:MAG: hypothetical protein NTY53_01060 [Kiritimatiellaeota bacterium]|nr:hypothetical protein [Kiritimatiellota bacterium]
MKRIVATIFLRCVVLAASLGIFFLSFWLLNSIGLRLGTLVFLVLFWIVGIEVGLLPEFLVWILRRSASRHKSRLDRLWFVDLDEEKQKELDEHNRGSSNNPTIR